MGKNDRFLKNNSFSVQWYQSRIVSKYSIRTLAARS